VKRASLLVALLLVASPALAEAPHAAEHGSDGWLTLLKHALNLAILGFVLVRFAGPALRDFLRDRAEQVREQLSSAERALAEAQRELRQLRAEVERADEEARDLAVESERAAEAESRRALERANESTQRLREDAQRIADQEIDRARATLRAEAAGLATELAAELLRQRLNDDDDRRLFAEFAERAGRPQ
jgi:F-type H+-transporting ATPase subunit b